MKSLWPVFLILFYVGCVNNPFGTNDIALDGRTIQGQVILNGSHAPEGILVWLESFDLVTHTNSNGYFDLTLPAPFASSATGGSSGSYNLYCYMANFSLGKTNIATRNGKLTMPDRIMTSEGVLREPVAMTQTLKVETRVQPQTASLSKIHVTNGLTNFVVRVDVTVEAVRDSVVIFFPPIVNGRYGPLLFRNLETGEVKVLFSTVATFVRSDYDTVKTQPETRTMVVPLYPDDLQVGEYEIIPYLFVIDETLPEGLRKKLRLELTEPGPEYLDVPFLRTGERRILHIVP